VKAFRPTVAEVDLGAVRHNADAIRGVLAPGVRMLAVVKANAYGHGDVEVARACVQAGVDWLGVALVEEGLRLRQAGVRSRILLLAEPPPGAEDDVVAASLTPAVWTPDTAAALAKSARAAGASVPVHLCVDTGMHREGVPASQCVELAREILSLGGLQLEGLWTHLASADEEGSAATPAQLAAFAQAGESLRSAGITAPIVHAANSAGALGAAGAHFDLVRAGIALYGLRPAAWLGPRAKLRPAMRLVSRVSAVRRVPAGEGISYGLQYAPRADTDVASVPIGYADGFPRAAWRRGCMLVRGRRRPVAGRVSMDTVLLDCGIGGVDAGDEVVVIGRQGGDEITADEVGEWSGTINYEVVSCIGPRVPRVYRD
jgi:alanine racemase